MSIKVTLPISVNHYTFAAGLETARRCSTDLRIKTVFRLEIGDTFIDFDTEAELREFMSPVATPPDRSEPCQ